MKKTLSGEGFTLLELLLVMLIMAMILGSGAAAFYKLRNRSEFNGATASIRAGIALAHQRAVTMRERVGVQITNDARSMWYIVTNNVGRLGETNYLPTGVRLISAPSTIVFYPGVNRPDSDPPGTNCVVIAHKTISGTNVITVYNLTGLFDVEER